MPPKQGSSGRHGTGRSHDRNQNTQNRNDNQRQVQRQLGANPRKQGSNKKGKG